MKRHLLTATLMGLFAVVVLATDASACCHKRKAQCAPAPVACAPAPAKKHHGGGLCHKRKAQCVPVAYAAPAPCNTCGTVAYGAPTAYPSYQAAPTMQAPTVPTKQAGY